MGGDYSVHVGYAQQYNPPLTYDAQGKSSTHVGAYNCAPEAPSCVKSFVSSLSNNDKDILRSTIREALKSPTPITQYTVKFEDTNPISLVQEGVKRVEEQHRAGFKIPSWINVNNLNLLTNMVSGIVGLL